MQLVYLQPYARPAFTRLILLAALAVKCLIAGAGPLFAEGVILKNNFYIEGRPFEVKAVSTSVSHSQQAQPQQSRPTGNGDGDGQQNRQQHESTDGHKILSRPFGREHILSMNQTVRLYDDDSASGWGVV